MLPSKFWRTKHCRPIWTQRKPFWQTPKMFDLLTVKENNESFFTLSTHPVRQLHLGVGAVTVSLKVGNLWGLTLWNETVIVTPDPHVSSQRAEREFWVTSNLSYLGQCKRLPKTQEAMGMISFQTWRLPKDVQQSSGKSRTALTQNNSDRIKCATKLSFVLSWKCAIIVNLHCIHAGSMHQK